MKNILLPIAAVFLLSACAVTMESGLRCAHCSECECCESGQCKHHEKCQCCDNKQKGKIVTEEEPCKICLEAERASAARKK